MDKVALDLGSGAGFDCFLAARKVGLKGKVIGIDLSPEMVHKAQEIAARNRFSNVEFMAGDIENLPLPDNSVDLIISNCVIHLSTDTEKVFQEAFRVLKSGGRLMISDIVLLQKLPYVVNRVVSFYANYFPEAKLKDQYMQDVKKAGFQRIKIVSEIPFAIDAWLVSPSVKFLFENCVPNRCKNLAKRVVSIKVSAVKVLN